MQREKLLGSIGLLLFFLFPLVNLLQLRDTDDAWRKVAVHTRPSVLCIHVAPGEDAASTPAAACAVVLDGEPALAVMAGPPSAGELRSPTPNGWVAWKTAFVDPAGEFAILSAPGAPALGRASGNPVEHLSLSGLVPLDPATIADVSGPDDSAEAIPAVLVAPVQLAELPMWIGVLRADRAVDGRALYHGTGLRPLRAPDAIAPAEAEASPPRAGILPMLQGAPFVTRDGVVLALYVGDRDGEPCAVPMARIREALATLPRRGGF